MAVQVERRTIEVIPTAIVDGALAEEAGSDP